MRSARTIGLLLLVGFATTGLLLARKKDKKTDVASISQMDDSQRALHALNRLTFGPRPGDVEKVRAMGVDKWIELQLHPEKIDDSALQARLDGFRTLNMSAKDMLEAFPPPPVIKAVADGRLEMPSDPTERAIYKAQLARYEQRLARKDQGDNTDANLDPANMTDEERAHHRDLRLQAEDEADKLLTMTPDQRYKEILQLPPDELPMLGRIFTPEQRQQIMNEFTPQQRETVIALVANPQQVIDTELRDAKIIRAAYSERQLEEVMTDFWFNHFNVFIGKGADRYLLTDYERDVIRPHALGKFQDLLIATAKSPAMLFYLDNWLSVGPDSEFAKGEPQRRQGGGFHPRPRPRIGFGLPGVGIGFPFPAPQPRPQNRPQKPNQKRERTGLNENYAREIMELHTLGVDGGYTQQDVTELAKVLTGWTIKQPRLGGGFDFNERMHEPGKKIVLGHQFDQGGEDEGLAALKMLAHSPATAHFISKKLAIRFVSDDPPPALVDRMAQTFLDKDGDIREVLRTMFRSPEFWAASSYRAKVKTPFEFVVSSIRATGADIQDAQPLVQRLNQMGMPLYGMQPPTGYSMNADAWVNSSALLNRMNFALQLGVGRMPGTQVDAKNLLGPQPPPDPNAALAQLEQALLSGDVSKTTHDTVAKQFVDPQVTGRQLDDPTRPPNYGVLAGLLLGSPEFQRR
jgi:uncharacterized protein (DUF1800 family)